MEWKSTDKHRSTPLSGKTQQNLENKSTPLPDQTQHKSENPPLSSKTKNWRGGHHNNINICLKTSGEKLF